MHRIDVSGIECYAYHGCLPAERKIGTYYTIDVAVFGDFLNACLKDELDQTVDYCVVSDIVVSEMREASMLIEHVAWRIIKSLKKAYSNAEFEVCITKIKAPIEQNVASVSFTLHSKDV